MNNPSSSPEEVDHAPVVTDQKAGKEGKDGVGEKDRSVT